MRMYLYLTNINKKEKQQAKEKKSITLIVPSTWTGKAQGWIISLNQNRSASMCQTR